MHKSVIPIVLVGVLVAGYAIGYTTAPKGQGAEQVTVILSWTISSEDAGFFAAADQGFYAEEGLSVTILRGYGSADTAMRVEGGEGEFGHVDMGTLILAESTGEVDLVEVCMLFHNTPQAIVFLPDTPITEPKDLEGKTIGANPSSAAYLMLIGPFAAATGLDVDTINFDFSAPYALLSLLLAEQVDAYAGWLTDAADLELEVGGAGMMLFSDHGVNSYSSGIAVKESYLQDHPDIVEKFVRATLKGWGWALNNREEAVDMTLRMYPELERDISEGLLKYTLDNLFWYEETQQYGVGYMIPEKVEDTIDLVSESFGVTEVILPEDIYTNEFVEDLPDEILYPLG